MIHNKVKRAAKKLKKDLHGCINIVTITEYLKGLGYAVVFFNTKNGDKLIKHYNLEEFSNGKRAFSYSYDVNIVFINDELHIRDKIYSLLHELGHIALNHLGDNESQYSDKRMLEAEAEAFLYEVITHNNILCIP